MPIYFDEIDATIAPESETASQPDATAAAASGGGAAAPGDGDSDHVLHGLMRAMRHRARLRAD